MPNAPEGSRPILPFERRSLDGLSDDDIRQYVLDFVREYFPVRRGAAEIAWYRRTTAEDPDLAELNRDGSLRYMFPSEQPLILVGLRGDFIGGKFDGPGAGMMVLAAQLAIPGARVYSYGGLLFAFDLTSKDPRLTSMFDDASELGPPLLGGPALPE